MNKAINENRISAIQILTGVLLFSVTYAVLRYHVFGGVPWKDFPFFILNKAISLSAFILLTYNFTLGSLNNLGVDISRNWLDSKNILGIAGFLLIIIHGLMSLLLFSSSVYAKFFNNDDTLTLFAGLSMLGGILAFVVLWVYNLSFQISLQNNEALIKLIRSKKLILWGLILGVFHLFFMGVKGWINPSDWNGGMPPVSLVAFLFFFIGYTINFLGRKNQIYTK